MGRWKKNKKLRTDDDGQQRRKKGQQAGAGVGYQGKNVDKDGWIVTSTRHPQQREPSNPVFEAFYKAQGVVPPGEWAAFMKTLLQPLPASFRINLDCDFAELLMSEVEEHMAKRVTVDDVEVEPIKKLRWFTCGHAYQLALDRRTLRRDDALRDFHELMKQHTDAGSITRQETVSMIPAVVLDVRPEHRVLDMCAAPGSKASQMLEVVNSGCARTGVDPGGYVLANDSETSRAYMLVHQCKRISTAALCVTTHRAQGFPGRGFQGARGGAEAFDRVLCDVPCSGDGTVRKTFNIWRSWYPGNAMGLHPLQLQIARRGAELLRVGGLMVYSTCSLNPVEDEAVVLALLQEAEGALELVDPRPRLPGLIVREGVLSWKVIDSEARLGGNNKPPTKPPPPQEEEGKEEGQEEEEQQMEKETRRLKALGLRVVPSYSAVPAAAQRLFRATHFPPADPAVAKRLNLQYCMRCLPHDQDTGGFFVALIRKVGAYGGPGPQQPQPQQEQEEVGGEGEKGAVAEEGDGGEKEGEGAEEQEGTTGGKGGAGNGSGGAHEKAGGRFSAFAPKEFFRPLPDDAWAGIRAFYGVAEGFPRGRLFYRGDSAKVVSYMSKGLVDDVQLSQDSSLKLVHVGTKMFDSVTSDRSPACPYRLAQDGLPFLLPYLTRRVVCVPRLAFVAAVAEGLLDAEALEDGSSAKQEIEALELGAFVVRMDPAALGGEEKAKERGLASFAAVAWKGFGSRLRLMCQSSDLFLYRCRLRACGLATAEELARFAPAPATAAAAVPQGEEKEKQEEEEEEEEEEEKGEGAMEVAA